MKRSILALVCSGTVLAGGATAASAEPVQVCTGTVSNMTINSSVWVPQGSVCKLDNVTVNGGVFAENHASIIATNSNVSGALLTKAGGYLNAWKVKAGRIDLDGSWGAYLNDVSVAPMGDVLLNGPKAGSPSNWVRPNVYIENSRFQRRVGVENADLTMVNSQSRSQPQSKYSGEVWMTPGSGKSTVTLKGTSLDSITSQSGGDLTAVGSTIGQVSLSNQQGPAQNVQFGTADGSLPGNQIGTFKASGPLNVGLWNNTFTGDASATLQAPSSLAGSRNTFKGNVSGDLSKLQNASAAAPASAPFDTSAQVNSDAAADKNQLQEKCRKDSGRATKHGSAHLRGRSHHRH